MQTELISKFLPKPNINLSFTPSASPPLALMTTIASDMLDSSQKPWLKSSADISDYFNYGFDEKTYRIYLEKQRVLREEFGHLRKKNNNSNTNNYRDTNNYNRDYNYRDRDNYNRDNYNYRDRDNYNREYNSNKNNYNYKNYNRESERRNNEDYYKDDYKRRRY